MPHVTRNEFAEMCGDDVKKLNVYIARGKVVLVPGNKKLIDPANPQNNAFMIDRQLANQLKGQGLPVPKVVKVKEAKVSKKGSKKAEPVQEIPKTVTKLPKSVTKVTKPPTEPREVKQQIARQNAESQKRVDQEYKKKQLEIEMLELKKEQFGHLMAKSASKLIPVDLVREVLKRHSSAINKNFEKGIERIATLFCTIMAGGSPTMYVRILEEAKQELSTCIKNAGRDASEDIATLVSDFSETLLRGQKKV